MTKVKIKMADVNGLVRTVTMPKLKGCNTSVDYVLENSIDRKWIYGLDGNAVNIDNIVEIISVMEVDE